MEFSESIKQEIEKLDAGYTLLIKLVILTRKYPDICTTIEEYLKLKPNEINNVNCFTPKGFGSLNLRWTALYHAIVCDDYGSSMKVIKVLLENGADMNISNASNCTPLRRAFFCPNINILKLMLEYDGSTNYRIYYVSNVLFENIALLNTRN